MVHAPVSISDSSTPSIPEKCLANDIFISYSRKDKAFVEQLDSVFRAHNRDPWIDWDDIQPTEDWWQAIATGIESVDTFIFILSPDSAASKVCRQEVEHAVKHNKRLIPIVRREGFSEAEIHPALSRHNWLVFREEDDFDCAFQKLIKALDTDLDHVRSHTRLLIRAIEWEKKGRNDSFLLRGIDLEDAEHWLSQASGREPQPTTLQGEYISMSRKAETVRQLKEIRRQRLFSIGIGALACVAIAAAFYSFRQQHIAEERKREAVKQEQIAKDLSDRNSRLAQENSRLASEPREYEKVLQNRVQFLEAKIRQAADAGRSAKVLYAEIIKVDRVLSPQEEKWKKEAVELVNEWLDAKPYIYANSFDLQRLAALTTGTRLQQAKLTVEWLKVNNAFYKYGSPKVGEVKNFTVNGKQLILEIPITESIKYFDMTKKKVSNQSGGGVFRFIIEKNGDRWKIADSQKV